MLNNKLFLIVTVFIIISVFPASAEDAPSYGAEMVRDGLEMFANSIGDSMISLGTGNSTVDRAETPSLIFRMITYTVDPYTFPWSRSGGMKCSSFMSSYSW